MRVLVLFAHPVETSFSAALHRATVEALRAGGHTVDDCDLNAEGFNPVLTRQERVDYHDTSINRAHASVYVDRLLAAEALVLVFPVWNYGYPAFPLPSKTAISARHCTTSASSRRSPRMAAAGSGPS